MKGVMPEVPQFILEWRRRTGATRWDEMWEGVLHMPLGPTVAHQDLVAALTIWLRLHWSKSKGNRAYHQVNLASVGGWPNNYRIPDLVLLTPDRFSIDHDDYFEGAPTAVIEIRSPEDETMEKLPFYAQLAVPEVWMIDRNTKVPEVYFLRGGEYEPQPLGPDGWLSSAATGVQLRSAGNEKIAVRLADDPKTEQLLPEDD